MDPNDSSMLGRAAHTFFSLLDQVWKKILGKAIQSTWLRVHTTTNCECASFPIALVSFTKEY